MIETEPQKGSEDLSVTVGMVGPDGVGRMDLRGVGVCDHGVLRVQLEGGFDQSSDVRVLGGGLIILFAHDPMPGVMGFWDVHAVRGGTSDGPEGRRFRGMLEAVDSDQVPLDRPEDDPAMRAASKTDAG